MTIDARIDYSAFRPGMRGMKRLHAAVEEAGLEPRLLELVRTRASQLNGCAHCLDMHTAAALESGETHRRLHLLVAWRETTLFTDRERAALAFTETVTLLPDGVDEATIEQCEQHYTPEELQALLYAIVDINSWNRLAVASRRVVGDKPAVETT